MKFYLLMALCFWPTLAFSNLQVFPTKIELSSREKSSSVTLRNRSDKVTTYQISAVYYRQDIEGRMTRVTDLKEDDFSIIDFLRFSPRRVVLKPNQEQVVRFMVRNTSKLDVGDYRAHIRFEPIEEDITKDGGRDNYVMMKIDAKVAINVPVIFHQGRAKGEITLESFSIVEDKVSGPYFFVTMKRKGRIFPYGTFKIFYQKDNEEELVSLVNGVSSYLDERRFRFNIEDFSKKTGKYILKFYPDEYSKMPLAQTEYQWKKD